ncbi:SusD-like starch-binding protein associating with outer membrane [Dyadobacter jejuensis]|uniref:SusD-like starch-binding protein associating with outer membrane n=1 Tax=Dyadobacter jejuensis TaxID=1082580 RepID=A0A316A8D7_9BACT|nr:SusD/RagB family nutrient-binding outer membrane lipoprotein [Dyadobacter jejuensis]PWJ53893.1 SusD-like starch-binding protein associating with outer membrane [Dyadobacter jejuensis]
MIKKIYKILMIALFLGGLSCESIVDDLNTDPNNPTNASTSLMLTGVQLANITIHEGHTARMAGMWSGYFTGIARQYPDFYNYNVNGATFDQIWQNIYTGVFKNGYVLIEKAEEVDNNLLIAIVKITQAHALQTATSCWGDVPYSQVSDIDAFPNPTFDPQVEVYESIQALLDEAIGLLDTGLGSVTPAVADVHFSGDASKWKQVAYTLKARAFHETRNYEAAYEAALKGVSEPGNSLMAPHGTVLGGNQNLMFSFLAGGRAGDMSSKGAYITTLLTAEHANNRGNDKTDETARLNYYFLNTDDPENITPNTSSASGAMGIFADASPFPLITYEENQLILAEAGLRVNGFETGLEHLNAYRSYLNNGGYIHSSYQSFPYKYEAYVADDFENGGMVADAALTASDALLKEILTERYITFFGQKLTFSDLRRTRHDAVKVSIAPNIGNELPERFIYSQSEVNSNSNAPNPVPGIFERTPINSL